MAGFCSGCGTSMADGVKFCPACGKASGGAPGAAVSSTPNVASAPVFTNTAPAGGGGALKIILIVLGILALLGVVGMGSCFYVAYRVKKAAHEFAGNSKPYVGKKAPCSFVSTAEVAEALGMPVQDAVPRGTTCDYVLGAEGDQHMMVEFMWQGGTTMMKLTHGAMTHISAGMDTFTAVPGMGDEGYVVPGGSAIMMRKGDVLVNIDMRSAKLDAEGGKKVATLIAERL